MVEMLTCNPPWHEFEAMAAIYKIATADFPKYELPKHVSEEMQQLLRCCFQKDASQRPSAEDLLNMRFFHF